MSDFLAECQAWWDGLNPQWQVALQVGGILLLGLVAGHVLGSLVARTLRAKNFDAALRLPGSPHGPAAQSPFLPAGGPAPQPETHGITPTFLAGMLVRLTIWLAAVWHVANQHNKPELADLLSKIITRVWTLAGVLVAALGLGSLIANRLVDWLDAPRANPDPRLAAAQPRLAAGAIGAAVYAIVALVVLLIGADMFDWPLTRGSALALWTLAHHVLIAGAALLIGWLGARWARDLANEAAASPEKRAGQYTALAIVAATTVLAVAVLLSSFGVIIGLAALAIVGFLLWLARGYLPDVFAGLQLRTHQVREVWFDGVAWQVTEIGFVSSTLGRNGQFCHLQNRLVLEARMQGAPAPAAEERVNG